MSSFTPDPHDLGPARGLSSARDPLLARAARYARWDGTQSIPALDADEIIESGSRVHVVEIKGATALVTEV